MLTRLKLRNFKSFREADIPLSPFTLVLGANGAGKSNLFDALRLLRSIGDGRSVRDALEGHALPGTTGATVTGVRGGADNIPHQSSNSTRFSIELSTRTRGATYRYFVEIDASRHRVVNEELWKQSHPGEYVYSTRPPTGVLHQDHASPIISARTYRNRQGLNPRASFAPGEFLLSQLINRRGESLLNVEAAEALRDELQALSPMELRPEVLRLYSPLGRSTLGEHGENFAAALHDLRERAGALESPASLAPDPAAVLGLQAMTNWLSEVTPRRITEVLTQLSPTREAIVAVVEQPFTAPIAAPSLSDGTLRFAALALAAVGLDRRTTLVIEEIENGINPTRVALLVSMLEQVTSGTDRVQVVASTHSPSVVDTAAEETRANAVVIGWDDDHEASHPVRVRDLPNIREATVDRTVGDLQSEGWLQMAAGI